MNDKLVRASDIFPALQSAGVPYNYATQRVIEQLPAVDAVEVCRCKDCRYGTIDQYSAGEYVVVCEAPKKQRGHYDVYALDWYCPMGQRREDGDA